MNDDQSFIKRAREQIFGAQRRRGVERRHEKIEREKETVDIELFLDSCKAEGLNENNPRDLAIMLRAWCLKKNEPLPDEMERDHEDLTF